MAMSKATMRAAIEAAYTARTGKSIGPDDDVNALLDICEGIIAEIVANAVVTVTGVTPGGGSAPGTIL